MASTIGGLLGHSAMSPEELYAAGRDQLTDPPTVELRSGVISRIETTGDDATPAFEASLTDGGSVTARRVLLAGGMQATVSWGRRTAMR